MQQCAGTVKKPSLELGGQRATGHQYGIEEF
jgi:hypothetical protein